MNNKTSIDEQMLRELWKVVICRADCESKTSARVAQIMKAQQCSVTDAILQALKEQITKSNIPKEHIAALYHDLDKKEESTVMKILLRNLRLYGGVFRTTLEGEIV